MIRSKILSLLIPLVALLFVTPSHAHAVIQSLNGQTGQTQSLANDSNVVINSSGNIHSLGWNGQLPIIRGGTGTSSFTDGSIPFFDGTKLSEDNTNFYWDNLGKLLHVGGGVIGKLESFSDFIITSEAKPIIIRGVGEVFNGGIGVPINIEAGDGGINVGGGSLELRSGKGGTTSGKGGQIEISAGDAQGGDSDGGDIVFNTGLPSGSGRAGKYLFQTADQSFVAELLFSLSGSDKVFTFPNATGTLSLLESDQTFTGLNKFEAISNSTVYVGSSTKSGCIALGDSDGDGVTYITANDGVLSASSTKPSICQ